MGVWLKIEGERIVNTTLVDVVEFRHHARTATLWSGGVNVVPESKLAYEYYAGLPDEEFVQLGQKG